MNNIYGFPFGLPRLGLAMPNFSLLRPIPDLPTTHANGKKRMKFFASFCLQKEDVPSFTYS
jgi:hypothetical protein